MPSDPKYSIKTSTLTGIANAIRAKTGASSLIDAEDMAAAIAAIPSGGGGSRLPSAYQEAEYIQTDGSAYIDTAYAFSGIARVEAEFYRPDGTNWYVFGVSADSGAKRFMITGSTTATQLIIMGCGSSSSVQTYITRDASYAGERFAVIGRWENGLGILDTTNFFMSTLGASSVAVREISKTAYVLGQNYHSQVRAASSGSRCYYLRIYDGASRTKVREFVPCYRKSDNEVGMYDLVNGKFYTNSGSGSLTKGSDVN